jgi:hypothetical protein
VNLLEGPADDAPFETLDVDDDIGQLGHQALDETRNAQRGAGNQ